MIDFKKLCPYLSEEDINKLEESRNFPPYKGAIYNPNKLDMEDFQKLHNIEVDKDDKYLFRFLDPLGKTVEHFGGAFYIMDPSATLISRFLNPEINEIVIDLCAAPGGKTISYAIKNPNSLIISNDISSTRVNQLKQNVERMGLTNVIITNHEPSFFLKNFQNFFDKVILDTPCSGTGMYRKEKELEEDFSFEKLERLLPLQQELLEIANKLLKDGGTLSYSTCSFSQKEDEEQINNFLKNNNNYNIIDLPDDKSFFKTSGPGIYLLPIFFQGEGQYICLLKKGGQLESNPTLKEKKITYKNKEWFISHYFKSIEKLEPQVIGVQLYNEKEKSTYSHAYSHTLKDYLNKIILTAENEALDYLHGDEININPANKGEVLVFYKKLSLGWGKANQGKLKNYLPKGIRLQSR